MDLNYFYQFFCLLLILLILNPVVIKSDDNITNILANNDLDSVFNGVYTECFMHLSYLCLQKKTLLYLKELNNLSEVSVIGDYVKFVKVNTTTVEEDIIEKHEKAGDSEELAFMIDRAVDNFFDNHVLKFKALGRDIALPKNVEEFVGRKRKGGGGGGGGHGGGHGGDDGGKKKMMMMAMMCMKMKLMMMVPAMMGMMGMMSFKGMMFSMMSFMISKMMLLMKLLEKKGASGFSGGGAGDGGWMASGGGGGAWMPAGGQDYAGGGGGGGYDANGQWQSRSIVENPEYLIEHKPVVSFVKPMVSYNGKIDPGIFKKPVLVYKKSNIDFNFGKEQENTIDDYKDKNILRVRRDLDNKDTENLYQNDKQSLNTKTTDGLIPMEENALISKDFSYREDKKRRSKRSIIDMLQNSYIYWVNKILGLNNNRRTNYQRYKIVNGVKYVYYPYPIRIMKQKTPKEIPVDNIKISSGGFTPILTAEDFNKGEIMEGGVESRMNKKKFNKMKDTVNDTVEDNPWE